MNKKYLLFGIHNHQPVGNFEYVLKYAYDNCYKPLVDVVKRYPSIKLNIHFSGWLLEWLYKNHPDYIKEIKSFVESGKIEIFAGGFYEPILPIFPQEDRLVQIKKLKDRIQEIFGRRPKGLWLAERVWEQELVKTLELSGMDYLPLDDSHFELSGFKRDELEGYYISEYDGHTVGIFPIDKELRYMIPFENAEKIVDYLKENPRKTFTFFDDGEKFGLWPGTYEHVYKNGWLDDFFKLISENDWIETMTFSEYFEKFNPTGRVYLPSSSYEEMLEWSLPSEIRGKLETGSIDQNRFIGNWRNFLVKYTEANLMHKKILYVRSKITDITKEKNNVVDAYLKSQANDAFWHGLFGGIYLPHLRKSIYENIIFVENEVYRPRSGEIDVCDFDCDGSDEILLSNSDLNVYIDPDYGGRILEIDIRNKLFNVQNTMTRRYEPYHDKMKDSGVDLYFDWYERFSSIDHFFGDTTSLDSFSKANYEELGDFVNQPFQYGVSDDKIVVLKRKGHVWFDDFWTEIELLKSVELFGNEVLLNYRFSNTSGFKVPYWYGCEFNFGLLSDRGRYVEIADKKFELYESREIKTDGLHITDQPDGFKIKVSVDKIMNFWVFPIHTVSYSESGPERIFQSICIVPNIKFELCPNEYFELKLSLAFESL